jgi:hypothetical protein
MDYKLQLNWQEDENAPRGTRYYVDIEKNADIQKPELYLAVSTEGYTWQEAMAKAIDKLQEIGEI